MGYTLLRFDSAASIGELERSAQASGESLKVLDLPTVNGEPAYRQKLFLEQHVALRGNRLPVNASALVDRRCGVP